MFKDRGIQALRIGALLAVAGLLALPMPSADAYLIYLQGNKNIQWKAGSPTSIWDDTTKTLSWSLSTINFPQPNWPTPAHAGAALQNSYQTHQDTIGTSINFNRLPDTSTAPKAQDGLLQIAFAPDETKSYYGYNMTGTFAVTWTVWDISAANGGALIDADIEFNGDGSSSFHNWLWTTGGPPPAAGSNDVEVTSVHEQSHTFGGGHTVYYYSAVWWLGRYPELLMFDRCLGPDDRVLLRTLYPAGTTLGTISGVVSLSGGGTVNKAVVVATDSNGIPQATTVTSNTGFYTLNVPPGTGYTVTVHHGSNINYTSPAPQDIQFADATNFINVVTTPPAFTVPVGGVATGKDITVTAGGPTMGLSLLALATVTNLDQLNASQTLFFTKGFTYSVKLECPGTVGDGNLTGVDMGPGITCTTGLTTASNNAGFVVVAVTCTVDAAATPGVRNVSFNRGGERCFAPSFVEVLDTGTLTVATGPQNPAAGSVAYGVGDTPLLQFTLAANAVEDIRIRKLQFNLDGAGPALPAVRLWKDNGTTAGVADAGDTRIFSGNAWANTTVSETITATPPGTIVFDNLCLTILAGTTTTLLLTADMPASGSGGYTVTFDPTDAANMTAHGMFWGDVLTPGGSTPNGAIIGGNVNGGTQSLGPIAVGTLSQIHTSVPQNVLPVGGSTDEVQITLRGVVTASAGTVGLEVEAQLVGAAFTGTGTIATGTGFASGTTCSVNVTGLTSGQSYHWQARGLSSAGGPSAWTSFGGNAETAADFLCDTSTTPAPSLAGMQQFDPNGGTIVAPGASVKGFILLQATTTTNNQGFPVRIEMEVQPIGNAFTGIPTAVSGFSAAPAAMQVQFQAPPGDYHWQARCTTATGSTSAYVNFNAAAIHFHLDAFQEIKANAGCIGRASGTPGGSWMIWVAAGAVLFGLSFRKRTAQKAAATLVVLVCLGSAVFAAEDGSLPRSLKDAYPGTPPASMETFWPEAAVASPEPAAAAADKSFLTLNAYVGWLLMDMDFKAMGTDFINRRVSGIGTAALGVEGLIDLAPDCRAGLAVELDYWGDVRIIGVGAVGSWRFLNSFQNNVARSLDTEHYVRLGVFYEKLTVTRQNFGSFDATVGIRLGYELRLALGDGWFLTVGASFQYSQWQYSPTVLSGDDKIGGFGGLISIGAAWLP